MTDQNENNNNILDNIENAVENTESSAINADNCAKDGSANADHSAQNNESACEAQQDVSTDNKSSAEKESVKSDADASNVAAATLGAKVSLSKEASHSGAANSVAAEHEAIRSMFGLDKTYAERVQNSVQKRPSLSGKNIAVYFAFFAVIGIIAAGYWFSQKALDEKAEAEVVAKKQKEIEAEEARRNRIEYAEIAFMESLPEQVAIAMDGKMQYAKTPDGSYTELRASKNTWIRFLPVKEDTILNFTFEAEGFKPLSRKVAYYDWFPAHSGDITLQKVFRKVVLEPDMTPRIPSCEGDLCDWTVFREIMFRSKYAELSAMAVVNDADLAKNRERVFKTHPSLLAGVGLDVAAALPAEKDLSPAAHNLMQFVDKHPFALYGAITVETDAPDTRISFLGEPLMLVKDSGSMTQVKVDPDKPFTFATYGQGHPIVITDPLSIRLEAPGYPAYVTEILPHHWRCTPISDELRTQLEPPAFTQVDEAKADYRHYVCDYSVRVKVDFKAIREISEKTKQNPELDKNNKPNAQEVKNVE